MQVFWQRDVGLSMEGSWSPCFSVFLLLSLSSYHAVQGRVDELRVHVGEAGELALVDVGDDELVGRGQDGLSASEELVEVFGSFATLKGIKIM